MKRLSLAVVGAVSTVDSSTQHSHTECALAGQRRGLKNLHQYPKARYKSHVKDTRRFARNWYLNSGNNYELVDEKGHEREALENFGEYRDDSKKDKFLFSTNRLADLPPAKRLDALVAIMQDRWKVRDNSRGFDKAKLMLEALECFSEMRLSGQINEFAALPEPDQDTFLQYVEGCSKFAQACSHSHPEAVAVLIRASQICDEMRCAEKRDEVTHMAELAAERMDCAYAFARPQDRAVRLNKLSATEIGAKFGMAKSMKLAEHFKDKPWALETQKLPEYVMATRTRKVSLTSFKENDCRVKMVKLHEPHLLD